ncbi:hypothetical protein [Hyphomicrobium nitrativorans]|nr:hypothetical protein [Hyphomicrobium nitrativorans]
MSIPASVRHRNSGAQYPGPSSRLFGGSSHAIIGGGHRIATFPTMVDGASAHMHLLHRVYAGLTFSAAIAKWSGGNNINSYLRVIESRTRWTRHDYVTKQLIETPDMAIELCKAMAWHEAGREYPMTDAQWVEAHEQFVTVIGGGSVPIDRVAPVPQTAPLEMAKTHLGERRIPGPDTNPFIEKLFIEVGSPLRGDDHSYCAVGAGAMLKRTGFAYIEGEAGQLARNYLKYGHALDEPEEGCLVIFWRVKPNSWQGHVAFVESWTATTLTIVGFNQSGAVTRMTVPRTGSRSQVLGYRRPVPNVRPVSEVVKEESVGQKTVGILGLLGTIYYTCKGWVLYAVDSIAAVVGFLPEAASEASRATAPVRELGDTVPAIVPILSFIVLITLGIGLYRSVKRLRPNSGALTKPPYETDIEPEADAVDMFDAPLPEKRPRRKVSRKTDRDKKPARKSSTRRKAA